MVVWSIESRLSFVNSALRKTAVLRFTTTCRKCDPTIPNLHPSVSSKLMNEFCCFFVLCPAVAITFLESDVIGCNRGSWTQMNIGVDNQH